MFWWLDPTWFFFLSTVCSSLHMTSASSHYNAVLHEWLDRCFCMYFWRPIYVWLVFVSVFFQPCLRCCMYTLPLSHGTEYATALVLGKERSVGILTFVRQHLRVRFVLKTVTCSMFPLLPHAFIRFSHLPCFSHLLVFGSFVLHLIRAGEGISTETLHVCAVLLHFSYFQLSPNLVFICTW